MAAGACGGTAAACSLARSGKNTKPATARLTISASATALSDFAVRPHWGKAFERPPVNDQLPRFRELIERYDPERRFANPYLEQYVY